MNRLEKCRVLLAGCNAQAMLCTSYHNKFYLSGLYSSSGYVLITQKQKYVIVDSRYYEEVRQNNRDAQVLLMTGEKTCDLLINRILEEENIRTVGFEGDDLSYDRYRSLEKKLRASLVPVNINPIRAVKDAQEIETIQKACAIADQAYAHILGFVRAGMREDEVANELVYFMKQNGAMKESFDTIAASGVRGSMPHAKAGARRIEAGDLVTLDFGAKVGQYCSDITRTFAVGKMPVPELRKIYETVRKAQQKGIEAVSAGARFCDADRAARSVIEEAGYGGYFGHNLGHSLGINDHEDPRLSPTEEARMEAGMVVTVEPGIYVPGLGGVRIEDDVLVTENGSRVLTRSPRQLIVADKE
ncbi:M24 family metallopeptidase [Caproiciproducens sp. CPB-2]|uniref:M24 family metallopeptidase n=1 Tax=Caproiciproducens sp. CPB-2 TaxID=3030017 RepID=UPI0023DA1D09|nr:M24 family metallopeptidase [Caproiciproducens sp. CPB-2]MDF1496390.1 M24 family metallopeptidase [Caproiciproducens sp. CPB-2]